jgi:hypothetical protein
MAATSHYSKIRFIGYPIPTTPAGLVSLGANAVAGTYEGDKDTSKDIKQRMEVLKQAVQTAKKHLPKNEDPRSVVNVFLAPEFFFHGARGPYLFSSIHDDPVDEIHKEIVAAFPARDYENWTFVCGTAITACVADFDKVCQNRLTVGRNRIVKALAQEWLMAFGPMKSILQEMLVVLIANCHSHPLMTVRNRALIFSNIPLDCPKGADSGLKVHSMTAEKYYASHEDFILFDTAGRTDVVTEQMIGYPPIDLSGGDWKAECHDPHAIFRQTYGPTNQPPQVAFGVEICLDHYDARLRSTIDQGMSTAAASGVHVHLLPSCGMQIMPSNVAADTNGFIFNCDGEYTLDQTTGPQQGNPGSVECLYANYVGKKSPNSQYCGHTQLARVKAPASGCDPQAPGAKDATFEKLDKNKMKVVRVPPLSALHGHFSGGPGEIHFYGPFKLYPEVQKQARRSRKS